MHEKTLKNGYISTSGQFLNDLETQPFSTSKARKAEEEKYEDIGNKRDETQAEQTDSKLWKGF